MAVITYWKRIEEVICPWEQNLLQQKTVEYDLRNYVIPVHHMTYVLKEQNSVKEHSSVEGGDTIYKHFTKKISDNEETIDFSKVVCRGSYLLVTCHGIGIVEKLPVADFNQDNIVCLKLESVIALVRKYLYDVESETYSYERYLTYAIRKIEIYSTNIVIATIGEVFDVFENDPEKHYITLVYKS